jgi:predicted Fe-S protein YdhL (DUF1289 family)
VSTSTRNPEYDAGNQRHVERAEKASKTARRQRDEAFRWLMADQRGRRIVWSLLGKASVFQSSMAGSSELTAFNEGRRDVGLALLADIMRLCPESYTRMQAEAHPKPLVDGEKDGGRDDNDT